MEQKNKINQIFFNWRESILEKLIFIQTGTGIDLHGQNINSAAMRAVDNAIHSNSMPGIKEVMPKDKQEMKVKIKLAVPKDSEKLDYEKIKNMIPEGDVSVEVVAGGMATTSGIYLEDEYDKNKLMYIVNTSIEVGY